MAKIRPGKTSSKKEVIIEKASGLFRAKGYTAATMRDLADAVGVEAASLYNHIGSKSEILQVICFQIAGRYNKQLAAAEKLQLSKAQLIDQVIRFHIRIMLEHFDEVFVANHEWKFLKAPYLVNFLKQRRNYEKRLVAIVEDGVNKKEFKKSNSYVTVLTILSALRGLEFWLRHKKNFSARVLENDMADHLLNGMLK